MSSSWLATEGPGLVKMVGHVGKGRPVSRTRKSQLRDFVQKLDTQGHWPFLMIGILTMRLVIEPNASDDRHAGRVNWTE